jgi:hypothetical protein
MAPGRSRGAKQEGRQVWLGSSCTWWEQAFERKLEAESLVWGQEQRANRGRGFVVSCGGSGEKGWRTQLELGRRKSFDDRLGAATFGTGPKRGRFLGKGGLGFECVMAVPR